MTNKPILAYYSLRGWVGPIRLLLAYLEVDYEEKLYPNPTPEHGQSKWAVEKFTLQLNFPNLPYWIDEKKNLRLTETKAILKHICREYDCSLLGRTLSEQSLASMVEEVLWDMWKAFTKVCLDFNEIERVAFRKDAANKLKMLSEFVQHNRFICSNKILFVDFLAYEILFHYSLYDLALIKEHKNLEDFLRNFEMIPQLNKYINSPSFIHGPCFGYKFKAKI